MIYKCEECGDEFISNACKPRKICYKNTCVYKRRKKMYGNAVSKNDYCTGVYRRTDNTTYHRNCLKCERSFKSRNKFRRLCDWCHNNNRKYNIWDEYGVVG